MAGCEGELADYWRNENIIWRINGGMRDGIGGLLAEEWRDENKIWRMSGGM